MKRARVVDFTASAASLAHATLLVLPFPLPSPHAPALSVLALRPAGAAPAQLLLAACRGALPPTAALAAALDCAPSAIEQRGLLRSGSAAAAPLECALVRLPSAAAAAALLARPLSDTAVAPRGHGLSAWLARAEAAAAVDTRGLQAAVDAAVGVLDAAGAAAASEKETLRARMQADGFTLVTRRSVLESEEGANAGGAGNRRGRKRTRPGGDLNPGAYAAPAAALAQADKVRRLEELRRGFEADAQHIARLKTQRKFQPF